MFPAFGDTNLFHAGSHLEISNSLLSSQALLVYLTFLMFIFQLLTGVDFSLSVFSCVVAIAMAIHKLHESYVQPTVPVTDGP